ncbi:MAG: hypothetical protein A2Y65_12215 [Deltaproteobacteria bacterium RBG_13_52_11]|nr:MAG: hypothetical protein A2Y65_12215 [Deltaproteobacteria bacterium RBG_13_52_11]
MDKVFKRAQRQAPSLEEGACCMIPATSMVKQEGIILSFTFPNSGNSIIVREPINDSTPHIFFMMAPVS